MRALKMNYEGAESVSVDWGSTVEGLQNVAQRAVCDVMTVSGTDRMIAGRGTDVAIKLIGYGAFDFLSMQHTLNFGALKATEDLRLFDEGREDGSDSISSIQMTLLDVHSSTAQVVVIVTNEIGETTQEVTQIP